MQKVNKIIPNLIILFNQYDNNLQNRIKADSIILDLDDDTNKTFNKLVKLSNMRFKAMKSGGNLNNIILKQQPSYTNIKNGIKKDIIFSTEYITTEKEKLYKSVNHFCVKKINKLRDKLIDSLKQKTKTDLKEMKKLKKFTKSERLLNLVKNKKSIRKLYNGNFYSKKNLYPSDNSEKEIPDVISPNVELKGDYEKLSNGIKSYQNLLTDAKKNQDNENKDIKIFRCKFKDIESHLDIKNIKFLSYDEKRNKNKGKNEKKDEKFNIANLARIKRFHQNLKYKMNKIIKKSNTNTNININNNNQSKNNFSIKSTKNYFSECSLYSNSKVLSEDNNKNKSNFNKSNLNYNFSGNKFLNPEVKNTIQLIKYESEKEILNNFENKIEEFNECFNKYFPTIDVPYKERRLKLQFKKNKKREVENYIPNFAYKRNDNIVLDDNRKTKREKIIDSFRKVYEEKLKKWDKEGNKIKTNK